MVNILKKNANVLIQILKNAINVMNDSTFSASVFFFRNILLPLSAV